MSLLRKLWLEICSVKMNEKTPKKENTKSVMKLQKMNRIVQSKRTTTQRRSKKHFGRQTTTKNQFDHLCESWKVLWNCECFVTNFLNIKFNYRSTVSWNVDKSFDTTRILVKTNWRSFWSIFCWKCSISFSVYLFGVLNNWRFVNVIWEVGFLKSAAHLLLLNQVWNMLSSELAFQT